MEKFFYSGSEEQMSQIAIVTDSNSGISQEEAKKLGIFVLPMPFFINDVVHYEDIDLTQESFYEKMADDNTKVSTSQPSPADLLDLWDELLRTHREIVHIPMSSGLSASCENAIALSQEYNGKVQVVDNKRISVTQKQSALDALKLAKAGKSAAQIKEILEADGLESSIYLMVDTLKYLKQGGRITPAAAMIGTVLNLKPVLQIQGEKLDAFAKVRGEKKGKKTMLEAMKKDIDERFSELVKAGRLKLQIAYNTDAQTAEAWKKEVQEMFPGFELDEGALPLSVACHTGPGILAIACSKVSE